VNCCKLRYRSNLKIRNQIILVITILLIVYFAPLGSDTFLNRIPFAFSQQHDSSFQADVSTINNISTQMVKVGDIEIAFKQLGSGSDTPIVLITGCCLTMDMWSPTLLKDLSKNRTVIIFDNRGAGESTLGASPFSIKQFANDTVGLLNALKIQKADVLGASMGSFIAQELALTNPNRVDRLILTASACNGNEGLLESPQVKQALNIMTNASSQPSREEIDKITGTYFPPDWFKANPNYQEYVPIAKKPVYPEIIQKQINAIENWSDKGTCDTLTNITHPTLVIVGTDDIWTPAANSLTIAERIPGAWLIAIGGAGHGLIYQYHDTFSGMVSTFLQTAD
jgi:pimeloyl-ACP methyl ester carboxylesterase